MLKCISLNMRDLGKFRELNNIRGEFNSLNEDFFQVYTGIGPIKQFILRKNVMLLKKNNNVIGYLWLSKSDNNFYRISSLFMNKNNNLIEGYSKLIKSIRPYCPILYTCERYGNNYELLTSLGFKKVDGTYEMAARTSNQDYCDAKDDLDFHVLQKHNQEYIRCRIQNEVFKNDARLPLTIDDMYYDEEQDYYYDKGAILVKRGGSYIGYGQIIIVDHIPTIVNVGVLKEYRGRGYGKALMLYLLNILREDRYNEVALRVACGNLAALNMYKSLGFNVVKEIYNFEYSKSGSAAFTREP